jgi:hypothetical protein
MLNAIPNLLPKMGTAAAGTFSGIALPLRDFATKKK